jgi:RNA polymerase sigma factor (sigma-70 family)
MAAETVSDFLRRLTRSLATDAGETPSDRELVEQFLADGDEAAFEALVRRHGAMVYRVCWRVLQQAQDTEDAFQATFLVAAQKLRAVRKVESVASWLHGIAHRVALKARASAAARQGHRPPRPSPCAPADEITWAELRMVLDAELACLPERWRLPLVLCYLEGLTQDEAAGQLRWSKNTLRRRLDEARRALGRRLSRRGVEWPATFASVVLSDCTVSANGPARLAESTAAAAVQLSAGQTGAASLVAPRVIELAKGALTSMVLTKLKIAAGFVLVLAVVGTGVSGGLRSPQEKEEKSAPERVVGDRRGDDKGKDPALRDKPDPDATKPPPARDKPDPDAVKLDRDDRIRPGDRLSIRATNTLPNDPIDGVFTVEASGKVALGPSYGRVQIDRLTLEEAEEMIQQRLGKILRSNPSVSVTRHIPVDADPPDRVRVLERRVQQLESDLRALRQVVDDLRRKPQEPDRDKKPDRDPREKRP